MEKKIILGTLGGLVAGTLVAVVIYMGILGSSPLTWQETSSPEQ